MAEAMLPRLMLDQIARELPSDPATLLTSEQHTALAQALADMARLRRDAETSSGTLRLA